MKKSIYYEQGHDAGMGYREDAKNPYLSDSYAFKEWEIGFTDGILDSMSENGQLVDVIPIDDVGEISDWGQPPLLSQIYRERTM